MTQKFIAFVMMQAQQISLFLGRIPHPQTGKAEVNLEAARVFIDQLEMIREKTRGNLTADETEILAKVLADLQMEFVKASSGGSEAPAVEAPSGSQAAPVGETPAASAADSEESKKRFSKSYGS